MYRNLAILSIALVTSCLAGCASEPKHASFGLNDFQLMALRSPARCDGAILFDREPGLYDAQAFNVRSDWPSTEAYYRSPEIMTYYERFTDRQGRGHNNYIYRRAETRRYMTAVR